MALHSLYSATKNKTRKQISTYYLQIYSRKQLKRNNLSYFHNFTCVSVEGSMHILNCLGTKSLEEIQFWRS